MATIISEIKDFNFSISFTRQWDFSVETGEVIQAFYTGTTSKWSGARYFEYSLPSNITINSATVTFETTRVYSGNNYFSAAVNYSHVSLGGKTLDFNTSGGNNYSVAVDKINGSDLAINFQIGHNKNTSKNSSVPYGSQTATVYIKNLTLTIDYSVNETATKAPTSISLTPSENATKNQALTLKWSGAKAGTNHAISGYIIQQSDDNKTWKQYAEVKTTATSGSHTVYSSSINGGTRHFRVITKTSDTAWNSDPSSVVKITSSWTFPTISIITQPSSNVELFSQVSFVYQAENGTRNNIASTKFYYSLGEGAWIEFIPDAIEENDNNTNQKTVVTKAPLIGQIRYKISLNAENGEIVEITTSAINVTQPSGHKAPTILNSYNIGSSINIDLGNAIANQPHTYRFYTNLGDISATFNAASTSVAITISKWAKLYPTVSFFTLFYEIKAYGVISYTGSTTVLLNANDLKPSIENFVIKTLDKNNNLLKEALTAASVAINPLHILRFESTINGKESAFITKIELIETKENALEQIHSVSDLTGNFNYSILSYEVDTNSSFRIRVTDSRNNFIESEEKSYSIYLNQAVIINTLRSITRESTNRDQTVAVSMVTYEGKVSFLDIPANSLNYSWEIKRRIDGEIVANGIGTPDATNGNYILISAGNIDPDLIYNFSLSVVDALGNSASLTSTIAALANVINAKFFATENESGYGLGLGGKATQKNFIDMYWDSRIQGNLNLLGDISINKNIPRINFQEMETNNLFVVSAENNKIAFEYLSNTSSYSEKYNLPQLETPLSASQEYNILTTKNLVAISEGGTNANTADAARVNLGAAAVEHEHDASNITTGILSIERGGTNAETAVQAAKNLGCFYGTSVGEYYGLTSPDGSTTNWIRTTEKGILPHSSDSTNGNGSLGSSTWPFASIYAKNLYGAISATNITSGTLPVARGGTGVTTLYTTYTDFTVANGTLDHGRARHFPFLNLVVCQVRVTSMTLSANTTTHIFTLPSGCPLPPTAYGIAAYIAGGDLAYAYIDSNGKGYLRVTNERSAQSGGFTFAYAT